jgi:glutathione S-transferase
MPDYQLHCFAQSGNAYRAALMLNLCGLDWEPVHVDFFGAMPQRTKEWRESVNEMGETPVLVHGAKKFTQSGVILTYLARRTGKFQPVGEDAELEALRWIIFDNQKIGGFLAPYRFLRNWAKPAPDPAVLAFLKSRIETNLGIVDARLSKAPFMQGSAPTIADVSMTSYLYYPAEEYGFDIPGTYQNIGAWMERIKKLPGWKHPYDLMPGERMPPRG